MRIIAGTFKGHRLASFDEEHIRPMTDRVKESLFNILRNDVDHAKVLDLYSGTGSIGLEALSRGAMSVDFVELNPKSLKIILKNIETLKVQGLCQTHKKDVLKFLKSYHGEGFDLVFIDPPFPLKICKDTLMALAVSQALKKTTKIVIEHSVHEKLDSKINSLTLIDTREYGDKILSFYEPLN